VADTVRDPAVRGHAGPGDLPQRSAFSQPRVSPDPDQLGETDAVSDWEGGVPGPLLALAVVTLLMVLLRWAFSGGRSLVARQPRRGTSGQYGLLIRVAAPSTFVEAENIRLRLEAAGLRATLAPTLEGPAVMIFPEDLQRARDLLHPPPPGVSDG
jgi:hypothetical protein